MIATQTAIEVAAEEWSDLLGVANVRTGVSDRSRAETATFATTQRVPALIRPGSLEEVQECVRIAARHRIPIYPVSTGMNWGYGSSVPVRDAVLLDLSRMNRIVDYDEKLAFVTLEPGVTQRQLYDFLTGRNSPLWMDATGADPGTSLIGNILERGFGHTPYGDRFANICGIQAVLANGDVVETGFAGFPGSKAASVYRWANGPVLEGLFSQSNFGVVTRLTLWLMPKPDYFQAFFFTASDLGAVVEAARPLRLSGTLRSAVHVANDYRILAGIRQYPWEEAGGQTPLPEPVMARLRQELKVEAWSGSGALYGSRGQVAEGRRLVRRALAPATGKIQFVDEQKLALAERFAGAYKLFTGWDLSRTVKLARPVLGLMRGEPTTQPTQSAYWRKRMPIPATPDIHRDRCGLVWCAPVAPMTGADAAQVAEMATRINLGHGFEPMLSFTLITERSIACVISITYDRDIPGEDGRAAACHEELLRQFASEGYYSYRLGIQAMGSPGRDENTQRFLQTLKRAVDPEGILAPGRYVPSA